MDKKVRQIWIGVPAENAEEWKLKINRFIWQDDPLFKFIEAHPELTAEQIRYQYYKQFDKLHRKSAIVNSARRWGLAIREDAPKQRQSGK